MFILASVLMSVTSAANVAVPLWLGGMVDTLRGIEPTDFFSRVPRYLGHAVGLIGNFAWKQKGAPDSQLGKILPTDLLFGVSVSFLTMIAMAFVLKEPLAHRLSTLRDADRIYVFARGKLVESGSYETLHDSGGVFASLVKSAGS